MTMNLRIGSLMLTSVWVLKTDGIVRYFYYLTKALMMAIAIPMNKQATSKYVPACTRKFIGHTPFLPDSCQHQTTYP